MFASPKTAPGTPVKMELPNGRFVTATVVGSDPKNTANLVLRDSQAREWIAHWSNTRLIPSQA